MGQEKQPQYSRTKEFYTNTAGMNIMALINLTPN